MKQIAWEKQITWDEVRFLKDKTEKVKLFVEGNPRKQCVGDGYYYDGDSHAEDEYERKIIDDATAQIRAHREKKFKDALARYIAEQGDST